MSGKTLAVAAVVIVVVLGVVVYIVQRQTGAGAPPARVLQAQAERIQAGEPFEVRKFTNEQLMNASVDNATSYRKIDGKLWAEPIECASCKQRTPAAPVKVGADGPLQLAKYLCPRCKKPAYAPD